MNMDEKDIQDIQVCWSLRAVKNLTVCWDYMWQQYPRFTLEEKQVSCYSSLVSLWTKESQESSSVGSL